MIKGILMHPAIAGKGYLAVDLRKYGIVYKRYIHILVAEQFLGFTVGLPLNERLIVNHKDGNKINNHYSNLEWVTYSENNQHAYDNNLKLRGENFYIAKLTEEQVIEIKTEGKNEKSYEEIGDKYGVSRATIRDIFVGKTWKHIKI